MGGFFVVLLPENFQQKMPGLEPQNSHILFYHWAVSLPKNKDCIKGTDYNQEKLFYLVKEFLLRLSPDTGTWGYKDFYKCLSIFIRKVEPRKQWCTKWILQCSLCKKKSTEKAGHQDQNEMHSSAAVIWWWWYRFHCIYTLMWFSRVKRPSYFDACNYRNHIAYLVVRLQNKSKVTSSWCSAGAWLSYLFWWQAHYITTPSTGSHNDSKQLDVVSS